MVLRGVKWVSNFFNDLLDLMIFFKNEMCSILNESCSYEITLTVLLLMLALCSCVLGALLGGDLGNSNGACPSPVRKSSHSVTHPAPPCVSAFYKGNDFGTCRQSDSRILYVWQQAVTCAQLKYSQSHTRAGKHLFTGDSWRSQYKLLVNSPKTRMGFRLSGEKREERVWKETERKLQKKKAPQLHLCCFPEMRLGNQKFGNIPELVWWASCYK